MVAVLDSPFAFLAAFLADVAVVIGLIVAVIRAGLRLRRPRHPGSSAFIRWAVPVVLLLVLASLIAGNVRLVIAATRDQGGPTPAQIVGTWTDRDGAKINVRADGIFSASGLPPDSGDPAGDGKPQPAGGHGTWQITTAGDRAPYVLFTLSGGSRFEFNDNWVSESGPGPGEAQFSWDFSEFDGQDFWFFERQKRAR